jgi:hypothetical protein
MGIFGKVFGRRRSAAAKKVLGVMEIFTQAALLMVHPSDYEGDEMSMKRLLVFLFGAMDALIQHHHITGEEMFNTVAAYLSETFPRMPGSDIEKAVSFLADASADPAWVPIMQRGGQAMVDWSRGDSAAPSRLFKVVHYGTEDRGTTEQLARSQAGPGSSAGATKPDARVEQDEIHRIHDIGRAIVVATTNSCDAIKRRNIVSPAAEQAFLNETGLKNSKFLEAMIFNEFMYFNIFMTTREARLQKMRERQFEQLRDLLVTSLSKVAIAAYFDHWSYELKEKMVGEFYAKLHDAEREYEEIPKPDASDQEQLAALFSKLASNVAQLCSCPGDAAVTRSVSEIARHEWSAMEMHRRIAEARRADQASE